VSFCHNEITINEDRRDAQCDENSIEIKRNKSERWLADRKEEEKEETGKRWWILL
jgi:hypothetical protein